MSDSNPETRLIVTDRLCLEDLRDAVISLRTILVEEVRALFTDQIEQSPPTFCVRSGETFDALDRAGLLPVSGATAGLEELLPLRSSDVIVVAGLNGKGLIFRQVSIELDDLIFLPAVKTCGWLRKIMISAPLACVVLLG